MANPIVNLNVRANTARAMADFKRFSDSLNNKFLVSGLKVDLITSTLRQINNEFQKSMGEQGLLGASSIMAAQNQAALLTSTFKNFGLEASKSINANMTKALSDVAVKAGGTMSDIKKTISAVPWISTNLSEEERVGMAKQMLGWQRGLRRAGVSENFGDLGQKFLSMKTTAGDMLASNDSLASKIGMTMMSKYGASQGLIFNAEERTRILRDIMNDPELNKFIQTQAKETFGFRTYIEDLNTKLFNPESGLFGSLKKVKMSASRTTTVFEETDKIINLIFGREGLFLKFFKKIGETFRISDPLKFIIMGMDFLDKQIKSLSDFLDSPKFQEIVTYVKGIFDKTWNFFREIYDQILGGGGFDSTQIINDIKGSGTALRQFIRNIGATIRGENIDKESEFGTSIISTLVEETGKTVVTVIQEVFKVFIDKAPDIAAKALPAMSKAFNNIMIQMFGGLAKPAKALLGFVPGPIGMVARTSSAVDGLGADNPWALAGVGAAAFAPSLLKLGKRGKKAYKSLYREGEEANRRYIDKKLYQGGPVEWTGDDDDLNSPKPPSLWDRLRGRKRPRPPGFMKRVRQNREFKLSQRQKFEKWDNLPGYSHPIGPLPDEGYGNGKPWAYDSNSGEYKPLLGLPSEIDRESDKSYVSDFSTYDIQKYLEEERAQARAERHARTRDQLKWKRRRRDVGRWMRKNPGKTGLIGTGVTLGAIAIGSLFSSAHSAEMDEAPNVNTQRAEKIVSGTNAIGGIVSGAIGGAGTGGAIGGVIGSIFPGIGNVLGATIGSAIGGVIGGLIPMLDKETRKSILGFAESLKSIVGDWTSSVGSAFRSTWRSISDGLSNWGKGMVQGLMSKISGITDMFNIFGRKKEGDTVESDESWWSRVSSFGKSIGENISRTFGFNNNDEDSKNRYHGLNNSGSALAMESRMSGNRSFTTPGGNIANGGEIIIPPGGLSRLAEVLETRVSMANRSNQPQGETISLAINIINPVMLGDNKELIESLRDPVLGIVNDAYKKTQNNRVRNLFIS